MRHMDRKDGYSITGSGKEENRGIPPAGPPGLQNVYTGLPPAARGRGIMDRQNGAGNGAGRGKQTMRKILAAMLCICLLAGAAAAEEEMRDDVYVHVTDEMVRHEVTGDKSVLLKIWDQSGLVFAYLRFDFYDGGEYRGCVISCPNEGEDYYRGPIDPETPEELENLRIECAYGVSDLAPEEAILQVMMNNPAEEHKVEMPEMKLESGKVYHLVLAAEGERAWLVPVDETGADEGAAEPEAAGEDEKAAEPETAEPEAVRGNDAEVFERLKEFFTFWAANDQDRMLPMCPPEWAEAAENPRTQLFGLLANRTPKEFRANMISGEGAERMVSDSALMDRNNGKEAEWYRLEIRLVKAADGQWYVDPESLKTYEKETDAPQAEPTPAVILDKEDGRYLTLKVWDHSGLPVSYLRFEYCIGDEPAAYEICLQEEGTEYYTTVFTPETPEELKDLRIRCFYGVSDLPPEEAARAAAAGNPAEEHEAEMPRILAEAGKEYRLLLSSDGERTMLLQLGPGELARTEEPESRSGADDAIVRLTASFFECWSTNNMAEMADLCTAEWKAGTEAPDRELFTLLGNRRPLDLRVEKISGTEGDPVRTVTVTTLMDRNNGKGYVTYRYEIEVHQAADGQWYVNPEGLRPSAAGTDRP